MECFPYFLALGMFADLCLPFLLLLAGLVFLSVTLPKFHFPSPWDMCCYRQLVLHQLDQRARFPTRFKGHHVRDLWVCVEDLL